MTPGIKLQTSNLDEGDSDSDWEDYDDDYGYDSDFDDPVGVSVFRLDDASDLSRSSELDYDSDLEEPWGWFERYDDIYRRPTELGGTEDNEQRYDSSLPEAKSPPISSSIATFGVSMGEFTALGVGWGAEVGGNYRAGSGLEAAYGAYSVAGPIVSVPLPFPSFNIGFSAPMPETTRLSEVDCSAIGMAATPLFSMQIAVDPSTLEFKSFGFSITVALQLGVAAGISCGSGLR